MSENAMSAVSTILCQRGSGSIVGRVESQLAQLGGELFGPALLFGTLRASSALAVPRLCGVLVGSARSSASARCGVLLGSFVADG